MLGTPHVLAIDSASSIPKDLAQAFMIYLPPPTHSGPLSHTERRKLGFKMRFLLGPVRPLHNFWCSIQGCQMTVDPSMSYKFIGDI